MLLRKRVQGLLWKKRIKRKFILRYNQDLNKAKDQVEKIENMLTKEREGNQSSLYFNIFTKYYKMVKNYDKSANLRCKALHIISAV